MGKDLQSCARPVIDLADVLKQRVIEGQPLLVNSKLDDAMAKVHAAAVNDLLESTGQAVTVVHIPNLPENMSNPVQPVTCKCGCKADGPRWSAHARGYVVRCLNAGCPAVAQARTKDQACALWNQTATKI